MLNVGSALIGATAIVASLVLFATQVNVERLPHRLFHRLSKDLKLLGAFGSAFILAIVVTILSTFIDHEKLAIVVIIALLAIVFILYLFFCMPMGEHSTSSTLYSSFADSGKPLAKNFRVGLDGLSVCHLFLRGKKRMRVSRHYTSTPRTIRLAWAFSPSLNYWTDGAKRAIGHAMSFARHYAEQGD